LRGGFENKILPKVKQHTIHSRVAAGRNELVLEGTPAEEGKDVQTFRVVIHMMMVLDFTLLSDEDHHHGVSWPWRFNFSVVIGAT
jgi:hypothetical protein